MYEHELEKHEKKQQNYLAENPNHKYEPYYGLIEGDINQALNVSILRWVERLESFNPDEMLEN